MPVEKPRFSRLHHLAHDARPVAELRCTRNDRDGPCSPRHLVDRAKHFEGKLRQAVAEPLQRQTLEHHIGGAAKGGHLATLLERDQGVGRLGFGAAMNAHLDLVQVKLLPIHPNASHGRDRALTKSIRGVAVIGEAGHGRSASTALATLAFLFRALLFEARRPDQLPARSHGAVGARDRCAVLCADDRHVPQARPRHIPSIGGEELPIDRTANQTTRRTPKHRAERAERRAQNGASGGQDRGRHQPCSIRWDMSRRSAGRGNRKRPATRRRQLSCSGLSTVPCPE